LSPMQNIGANPGVIRQSGMHEFAFNEGGTTESSPFRPYFEDEKGFFSCLRYLLEEVIDGKETHRCKDRK
jgi:hypothetical protein